MDEDCADCEAGGQETESLEVRRYPGKVGELHKIIMKSKFFFIIGLLIPTVIVFKSIFLPGPLAWGDAPHFYGNELTELVSPEPYAWTLRGENFGGIDPRTYIFPYLFLYGILGGLVGNDLAIRIIFYVPAIVLSLATPILLTRYLKFSRKVSFFASLIYILNTYFILLVDGGQVGVALAYGLFPLTLLFLKKLIDQPKYFNFWFALFCSFLLTITDPRVSAVSLLTIFFWASLERNWANLKYLVLLGFALAGLSSYWFIPLFKLGGGAINLGISKLQLVSLLDTLTLFNPHFPGNVFGQVTEPAFYFLALPIVIALSFWIKPKRKDFVLALIFLLFAFLSKGSTPPLGRYYDFLTRLPFGFAFRDATKFMFPTILVAGILVGKTAERIKSKFFVFALWAYVIFLISPAITGKLNFVLSNRKWSSDYQKILTNLQMIPGEFRVAWFPERHPMTYETKKIQAIDAKVLADTLPFGQMNTGSFDRFNFLHNSASTLWFENLGIKYLIFSGSPRVVLLNQDEKQNWDDLLGRVATISGLVKKDWSNEISVYEVRNIKPPLYASTTMYAVVGGPLNIPIPAVYFEDGNFKPHLLEGIDSESVKVVFSEGKNELDLAMSFLKEFFVGSSQARESQWSVYSPADYLTYKYQLLIRDYKFKDFDYGRGVAISTQRGEKIKFDLEAPESGNYVLVVRKSEDDKPLKWDVSETRFYKKGWHEVIVENQKELTVLNVVALIPQEEFVKANNLAVTFVTYFGSFEVENFGSVAESNLVYDFNFERLSPFRYRVEAPKRGYWIIFTNTYNPGWKLMQGKLPWESVPVYSMVNGFYIKSDWTQTEIVFDGQKQVRFGMWGTVVSLLFLVIIFLWFLPKNEKYKS